MLREDSLKTIRSAIARGVPLVPTPEAVRAIALEAGRMRAGAMRAAFHNVFGWLWRGRDDGLPVGGTSR